MNQRLSILAPAKVNLFLKVLSKRPDGFHEIETLFERISLCDKLTFYADAGSRIRISTNHPQVPTGRKNLVFKVAQMLKDDFEIEQGMHIHIDKRIPVAAGLAGGSTNAASTLVGLNQIWGLGMTKKRLISYAQKIGSDVPFFLADAKYGLGTGRGDRIKPINCRKKLWHVLVVPKKKVYANQVYGALKLQLTKKNVDVNILIRNLRKSNNILNNIDVFNDLEPAVLQFCPSLLRLKERFKSLSCQGVMISGSGPCVFGLVESEARARVIAKTLSRRYCQVFVAHTF